MSTFRGNLESWGKYGGQLRCTMTNDECPNCKGRIWREERVVSEANQSKHIFALICHACQKVYVEKKELVEP